MPSQIYEILSLMMRYWFAALGVLIVLRAFWWLWKDHRSREKKRRSLPDAGSIGEFVVESDCAALPQDTLLPVPADGTLGSVRSCDIVVPARGVSPRHLDVMFRNGYGLYIIPWRGAAALSMGRRWRTGGMGWRIRCSITAFWRSDRRDCACACLRD